MRIDRLDLLSYGHLRGQSLDLSQPDSGLTLVLGPNEAGKSTTLRAITALLFGIDRRNTDDHRMGRESLRIGAAVRDGASDGREEILEVVRQGLTRAPLVTPEGEALDEALLAAMFGGVERSLFTALFCIDHDELHERSVELLDPEADIGRLIFSASLGASTLSGVLRGLEAQADGLFRPRGSNQSVARALSQARDLKRRERELRIRSRDYERAERDLARLEKEADGLQASAARLRARERHIERLLLALPKLAKRGAVREQLDELAREGLVQSATWAVAVGEARDCLADAEAESRRAVAAQARVQNRIAALPAASQLIVGAQRFDDLLKGVERYRKDRDDLPGLSGELTAGEAALAGLLERLGVDEGNARRVTDAQLATIGELANARGALDTRLTSSREEVDALAASIEVAKRELRDLPETPEVSTLEPVVAVARSYLERERQIGRERAEVDALAGDVEAGVRRLGLEVASAAGIESLPAPTSAVLRDHREALAALDQRRNALKQAMEGLDRRAEDLRDRRTVLISGQPVPDADAVEGSRARRDEGWSLVRRAWLSGEVDVQAVERWSAGRPLEDAFEDSLHDTDYRADERFAAAEQLAGLAQIDADLGELEEERRGLQTEQESVDADAYRLDEAWASCWRATGVTPTSVGAAEEWLSQLAEVQRAAAQRRQRRASLEETISEVTAQREAVVAALPRIATPPATLALAIEQADIVLNAARSSEEASRAKRQVVQQGEASLPLRQEAVQRAQAALDTWTRDWATALIPLGLPASTGLAAGRETVALLRDYRARLAALETLRGRVEGIKHDMSAYASRVRDLLEEIAPNLLAFEVDQAIEELKPQLDEARSRTDERRVLLDQLETEQEAVAQAEREVVEAGIGIRNLCDEAGLGKEADLAREQERASHHARLDGELREIEDDLLQQCGGLTVEDLVAAVASEGDSEDELRAMQDVVTQDLSAAEEAVTEANRAVGDARTKLKSLVSEGEAAALEQEAELEFAVVAAHVGEFARVALAAEILRRVVADYSQRNQGPILELAAGNFVVLTDGAFTDLQVDIDGERQLLLARRKNGEVLHLTELSEGTVDQLYLALRLAGLEHHIGLATHFPPVILDDLLVNFDDERAASALRLFARIGQQAQVLLFTHHRHLRDLAEQVLPADQLHVAELAPRDHSAPSEAPERPLSQGGSRDVRRMVADEAGDVAIVAVLDASTEPLGKSEVLRRADLPEAVWNPSIARLVNAGKVLREGQKRGAKYRLSDS